MLFQLGQRGARRVEAEVDCDAHRGSFRVETRQKCHQVRTLNPRNDGKYRGGWYLPSSLVTSTYPEKPERFAKCAAATATKMARI